MVGNINNLNGGSFVKSTAGVTNIANAAFSNAGNLRVDAGNLTFGGGFQQTAGTTRMNGGDLTIGVGSMVINGGNVRGQGTVFGDVALNGGSFAPGASPGTTFIAGDFTQTGGTLGIELGGQTQGVNFDLLDVTGNVTITAGNLGVSLFGGFIGNVGDLFEVINFGGVFTGNFSAINSPATHTLGSALLANSFELSFLGINLPPTPTGTLLDLLNEIAILDDNQDRFIDEAAIGEIEEDLRNALPAINCL